MSSTGTANAQLTPIDLTTIMSKTDGHALSTHALFTDDLPPTPPSLHKLRGDQGGGSVTVYAPDGTKLSCKKLKFSPDHFSEISKANLAKWIQQTEKGFLLKCELPNTPAECYELAHFFVLLWTFMIDQLGYKPENVEWSCGQTGKTRAALYDTHNPPCITPQQWCDAIEEWMKIYNLHGTYRLMTNRDEAVLEGINFESKVAAALSSHISALGSKTQSSAITWEDYPHRTFGISYGSSSTQAYGMEKEECATTEESMHYNMYFVGYNPVAGCKISSKLADNFDQQGCGPYYTKTFDKVYGNLLLVPHLVVFLNAIGYVFESVATNALANGDDVLTGEAQLLTEQCRNGHAMTISLLIRFMNMSIGQLTPKDREDMYAWHFLKEAAQNAQLRGALQCIMERKGSMGKSIKAGAWIEQI